MSRFKSRKFWMTVGAIGSLVLAEYTGIDVSPEVLGSVAVLIVGYVFAQSNVDKAVVSEQVKGAMDTGKLQLELYAKNLETELQKTIAALEYAQDGPTVVEE